MPKAAESALFSCGGCCVPCVVLLQASVCGLHLCQSVHCLLGVNGANSCMQNLLRLVYNTTTRCLTPYMQGVEPAVFGQS